MPTSAGGTAAAPRDGFQEALVDFQAAGKIPDNLPSDQGGDEALTAEISYGIGLVYEARGESEKARRAWEIASPGPTSRR